MVKMKIFDRFRGHEMVKYFKFSITEREPEPEDTTENDNNTPPEDIVTPPARKKKKPSNKQLAYRRHQVNSSVSQKAYQNQFSGVTSNDFWSQMKSKRT